MGFFERNRMRQVIRVLTISLGVCLFWFSYLASETSNLSPELQTTVNTYQELIKTHQYAQAVTLIENTLKEAQANSSEESVLTQLKVLLDDAQRQSKSFSNLIKSLSSPKKPELYLDAQTIIIIDKANESGVEGRIKGNLKDTRKVSWADIPMLNIYGLFDISKLKGEDKFNLAIWCFNHGFFAQAETVLAAFYKEQSSKIALINPLLARIRNIPLPQGGFTLYNETTWITAETTQQRDEILKKLGTYKEVLDKSGADKERLPWDKAREKETEHLIVKANLSVDALNDICLLLESTYFAYQDLFGCEQPQGKKLRVMIFKNKEEYQRIYYDLMSSNPPEGSCGMFIPASDTRNKSKQDHLLSFYAPSRCPPMTSTLPHECTHYAMGLLQNKCNCFASPAWLDERWATYNETSKLEGKRLVINVINQVLLPDIKDPIKSKTYIKLKDFINISQQEYLVNEKITYPESWGLIYFLINGQGGKYKLGLQAYMEAWKKGKIATGLDNSGNRELKDKSAHLKLFEECMGVPIDQLEQEWKEYILQLK